MTYTYVDATDMIDGSMGETFPALAGVLTMMATKGYTLITAYETGETFGRQMVTRTFWSHP